MKRKIKERAHMQIATLKLEDLTCPSCQQKIEAGVKDVQGVDKDSVKVLFNASKVKLKLDEEETSLEAVANKIESLGYQVLKSSAKDQ